MTDRKLIIIKLKHLSIIDQEELKRNSISNSPVLGLFLIIIIIINNNKTINIYIIKKKIY